MLRSFVLDLLSGKFDDKSSSLFPIASVLDPHPPIVKSDMFCDKCEAQPGAIGRRPSAGSGATSEALEDKMTLFWWNAGALILNNDVQELFGLAGMGWNFEGDFRLRIAVNSRIIDEVRNDSRQSPAITLDGKGGDASFADKKSVGGTTHRNCLFDKLQCSKFVKVESDYSCIKTRYFEEVFDKRPEAGDVAP
jgi:hypothetical protein